MRAFDGHVLFRYTPPMEHSLNRKSTNLTLDAALLAEAKSLKVNLSRAAEKGIRRALQKKREAVWKAENKQALASSNNYVDEHGLPLALHRQF